MKIVIGQAYHLRFDGKLWREMKPYPPLGSLYAAAVARQQGHDVCFHDAMLSKSTQDWTMLLEREQPDLAILYEDNFNYLTKMCLLNMREAAVEMLGSAKRIGARSAVCSSDATDHPDLYLSAGADYIIRGEGEQTLAELLSSLESQQESTVADIEGLTIATTASQIVTPSRNVLRHLDQLPMPAWDLADLERYREIWLERHGYYSINLVTTRGCPYHCNWCAKPIWGQRYNGRSPANVVDEIDQIRSHIDIDHIWFMDDIFGLKPGWINAFSNQLAANGTTIRFKCLSRADLLMRPGEVDALQRAGCETVWIGAESGSQKILDAMEKGTTVEQIEASSERLKDRGIRRGFFIQLGYPGETWQDIKKTFQLLSRTLPEEMGVSVSYPLPGTAFYDQVKDQLTSKTNWTDSDDLAMLYQGEFPTRSYRRLHSALHHHLNVRTILALGDYRPRACARLVYHAGGLLLDRALVLLMMFLTPFQRGPNIQITPELSRQQSGRATVQEEP